MQAPIPDAALFCPVCERPIDLIWLWQDPASSRIRMFCQDCSYREEYAPLPKQQRTVLSPEQFQRFAARRLLVHVRQKELGRGDSAPQPDSVPDCPAKEAEE